jgi:hypothetical protein
MYVYIHVFLTSALVAGEWSTSRRTPFAPGGRTPYTHWIGCWMGPRTDLDDVKKKKLCPYRDMNSDPSVFQSVASRYTDYPISTRQEWER